MEQNSCGAKYRLAQQMLRGWLSNINLDGQKPKKDKAAEAG
jgi:hypothetical protein